MEWNFASGINHDLSVPTEISQHPSDSFFGVPRWPNIVPSQRSGLAALGCGGL